MIKTILYIFSSVILFFSGVVVYGVLINSREIPLSVEMEKKGVKEFKNVKIVVRRMKYTLDLYSDTVLVKTYKAVFGRNNSDIKESAKDFATPRGHYKICRITSNTKYYKCFRLNYPNETDAAEAFKKKIISKKEYLKIIHSLDENGCPPQTTYLGGRIGIHGIGKYDFIFKNLPFVFNWTNGSIALSNEDIDELSRVVKIGTPVIIKD